MIIDRRRGTRNHIPQSLALLRPEARAKLACTQCLRLFAANAVTAGPEDIHTHWPGPVFGLARAGIYTYTPVAPEAIKTEPRRILRSRMCVDAVHSHRCLRIMTRTGARSRLPTISLSSTASGSLVLSTTALATSFSRTLNQTRDIADSVYEGACL